MVVLIIMRSLLMILESNAISFAAFVKKGSIVQPGKLVHINLPLQFLNNGGILFHKRVNTSGSGRYLDEEGMKESCA